VVVLGLVLLALCIAFAVGVALDNPSPAPVQAYGNEVPDLTIAGLFLLGAAVGALALLGLSLVLSGARRKRAKKLALTREVREVRTEQETLAEENARLQAQLERERSAPAVGTAPAAGTVLPEADAEPGKHAR
jgi:hypothetical protein